MSLVGCVDFYEAVGVPVKEFKSQNIDPNNPQSDECEDRQTSRLYNQVMSMRKKQKLALAEQIRAKYSEIHF